MLTKKEKGLASSAVVLILLLCGVVVSIFSYDTGLSASDTAVDGSFSAYEKITGENLARPNTGPVGAYPVSGPGFTFADYYFDNFIYESGFSGEISENLMVTSKVKQTKKKADTYEVVLEFESPANLSTVGIEPDVAIVIVVDTSGSMQYDLNGGGWCNNPACSSYQKYSTSHSWQHRWGINPETGENTSRFRYASEALAELLDEFSTGDDSKHMVSIVYFGESGEYKQDWIDINNPANLELAKSHVTYSALSAKPRTNTAQGTGLECARTLLKKDAVKNIPYKYVLMVTDGRPENTPSVSGVTASMNETGTHGSQVASLIEAECGATVQCVAFGTAGDKMKQGGKYVNDWLKYDVATSPEDYYSAENADDLGKGLHQLYQKLADEVSLFVMSIKLNDCVDLNGITSDTDAFEVIDGEIKWKMREDGANILKKINGDVVYVYEFKFLVVLDKNAPGFEYGQYLAVADEISIPTIDLNEDGTVVPGADVKLEFINSPQIYAVKSPN